jgi:hypothetical protein
MRRAHDAVVRLRSGTSRTIDCDLDPYGVPACHGRNDPEFVDPEKSQRAMHPPGQDVEALRQQQDHGARYHATMEDRVVHRSLRVEEHFLGEAPEAREDYEVCLGYRPTHCLVDITEDEVLKISVRR